MKAIKNNTLNHSIIAVIILLMGIVFAPSANAGAFEWAELPEMNTSRFGHGAVVFDGKIYVFGGRGTMRPRTLDLAEVYDIQRNGWRNLAPLPLPLMNFSITATNTHIYIFGGVSDNPNQPFDRIIQYSPDSNTYKILDVEFPPLYGASVHSMGDSILIIGGASSQREFRNEGRMFYPNNNTISNRFPTLRHARAFGEIINHRNLLIVGGVSHGGPVLQIESLTQNGWEERLRLNELRVRASYALLGDTIMVIGGLSQRERVINTVSGFIFSEQSWTDDIPSMHTERTEFASVVFNDKLYVIGGRSEMQNNHDGNILNSVEVYYYNNDASVSEIEQPISMELLTVYPNPSNSIVNVLFPNGMTSLTIYDNNGRILEAQTLPFNQTKWSWNSSSISAGIYYVQVQGKYLNTPITSKIVIIK